MANTVVMSALTMIALTGITLTTLKYRHDDHSSDEFNLTNDLSDDDVFEINPKFHYVYAKNHSAEKNFVKRSSEELLSQYSIDVKNPTMNDEVRREKIKEVIKEIAFEFRV